MHINYCNTGEVEIVMLHQLKRIRAAIEAISDIKTLKIYSRKRERENYEY